MLGFPKKDKKQKNEVDAEEFLSSTENQTGDELIETTLSPSPNWKMAQEDQYVFAFHNTESPKLKINQISIYPVELKRLPNNNLIASALIKNTVQKQVQFNKTTISLLDSEKNVVAKKKFDLEKFGVMPANTARPWKFVFTPADFDTPLDDLDLAEWSLAFEIDKSHRLDLESSWENSIAEKTKNDLEAIVKRAKKLKPGEVNFMGVNIKQKDTGEIITTILIRNGANRDIILKHLPLGLKDASEEEVAKGGFKLNDLNIKANTSKPWNFVFPKEMILKDDIDLTNWSIYPLEK